MRQFENLKIAYLLLIASAVFSSCKKEETSSKIQNSKKADAIAKKQEICDADFDTFFKKFEIDTIFQMEHIKFPLKNSHLDDGYHNMIREDIPISKYSFMDFSKHKDAMKQEYDKYQVEITKQKDSVFYFLQGYDNGILTNIKFAFENGCWHLVEIEDQST